MRKSRLVQVTIRFRFALLITALAVSCAAKASGPFEGDWTFKYSCDGTTGPYAEQCLRGEGDSFSLYGLTQDGERICGDHVATAYGQRKVDEGDLTGDGPSIYGTVAGNVAIVQFRAWTGAIGTAKITLRKDAIVWHVVKRADEQSWFPDDATLSRVIPRVTHLPTTCGSAPVNPGG